MIPVFLSAIQIDIMSNISNCLMASDGREKVENLNNAVAVLKPKCQLFTSNESPTGREIT
jgi:hypothetical protein